MIPRCVTYFSCGVRCSKEAKAACLFAVGVGRFHLHRLRGGNRASASPMKMGIPKSSPCNAPQHRRVLDLHQLGFQEIGTFQWEPQLGWKEMVPSLVLTTTTCKHHNLPRRSSGSSYCLLFGFGCSHLFTSYTGSCSYGVLGVFFCWGGCPLELSVDWLPRFSPWAKESKMEGQARQSVSRVDHKTSPAAATIEKHRERKKL